MASPHAFRRCGMVDGTSVAAVCSLVVALVHVPLSILSGSQCSGLAGFLKFVKGFIMSCTVVQIDLGTTASPFQQEVPDRKSAESLCACFSLRQISASSRTNYKQIP